MNGYSNLASNKKKKKRKRYLLFCDKASQKNTQKRKAIYIQKYSYKYTSPTTYLHMYYVQPTYLHVGKSNNEKAQQMSFLSNTVQSTPILQFRVRPRFFDQVGHETMYASSGNKHFFH